MTDDEFVRLFQDRAGKSGHYIGKVDGVAGPMTVRTLDAVLPALVAISPPPPQEETGASSKLGAQAETRLKGVDNVLANLVREAATLSVVPFTVTEGLRTKERQAQLVKAGASKTQNSRHLTGHAVDLWPLDPKTMKPLPSDAAFKRGSPEARKASNDLWAGLRAISIVMKELAKKHGVQLEWGGDWGWDAPHFQLNRAAYPA